jgi:hypothetical protein
MATVITPKSDVAISAFPDFMEAVRLRLAAGRETYGDSSFTMPLQAVNTEIAQELMDLCGWAFILWTRVQNLERQLRETQDC